tara:strand:+ start:1646 stop:1879 length:234 start_codon:yes stop_codon:yes gene_type:complete
MLSYVYIIVLLLLAISFVFCKDNTMKNTDGFTNIVKKSKQPSKEGFISNSYSNINESFNMLQSYKQPEGCSLITFIN